MTINELENQYVSKGKSIGGMLLFDSDTAISFINEGVKLGFSLTGVEGFKLFGSKIQPFQEHSNDIADTNCDLDEFVDLTKSFISERKGQEIWFEVVFSENE